MSLPVFDSVDASDSVENNSGDFDDVVSVLMDFDFDAAADAADNDNDHDCTSVITSSELVACGFPMEGDEEDNQSQNTAYGTAPRLCYAPKGDDEQQLSTLIGVADPHASSELNHVDLIAHAAIMHQRLHPELAVIVSPYDAAEHLEQDCESFMEAAIEGDLDAMKNIAERYNQYPVYKLKLISSVDNDDVKLT